MKTPHKLSNLILLLIALIGNTAFSQSGSNLWEFPRSGGETVTEPSPAAEAMRRYIDFPVSYATGTANISIPLVELPGGTVNVELGLSYHTGGIKVSEISGGIGLGWSLSGIGSVSRQINGFPDEWKGMSGSQSVTLNVAERDSDIDYYKSILEGKIDCEYDLYAYDFPGYAGYFIIKDNIVLKLPDSDIDIQRVPDPSNKSATDAFIITPPDGTEYRFDVKEHIEYRFDPDRMAINKINRGYDAVSTWNLSKIVGPERVDSITISYETLTGWQRNHDVSLSNINMKFYDSPAKDPSLIENVGSVHYTKFIDPKVPKTITSRSGRVDFDIKKGINKSFYAPNDIVTGMRLYNYEQKLIKTIKFENEAIHNNYRQQLDKVSIICDDILVDYYKFHYIGTSASSTGDVFGYAQNGNNNRSIINNDLKLSSNRKPGSGIYCNLLDTITDIKGLVTALFYSPATVDVTDSLSIFLGKVTIGPRLRQIITGDSIRIRTFEYSDSICNIDLNRLSYDNFLSQSGVVTINDYKGLGKTYSDYELNVTFTSSSKTRGYPVEQARIYYGKVTELTSGQDIPVPIKTVYEYDLSNCINPYFSVGGKQGIGAKALGVPQDVLGVSLSGNALRIAGPNPTRGYYQRLFGGGPMLKRITDYENVDGIYQKRQENSMFYSGADSMTITDGVFCESVVYRARELNAFYPPGTSWLNVESLNDVNYFRTNIRAKRMVCDSIKTTTYYPDGNSRTVSTRYVYTGSINKPMFRKNIFEIIDTIDKGSFEPINHVYFPGFGSDSISATTKKSFYPLATIISCGNDSKTYYDVRSEHTGSIFKDSKSKVRQKRLPVIEKWVLRSNGQSDSLFRQYEYGNFNCSGKTLIRPTRIYQYATRADSSTPEIIFSQNYSKYDWLGRVTEMTDNHGQRITVTWMSRYDLLSEISQADANLVTRYTHSPLTGCTSITMPNGQKRLFTYTAGRLSRESNTDSESLISYSYNFANDNNINENFITRTIHDSNDSATDTIFFNSRGLQEVEIKAVAGGSHVKSYTLYDGLDRLKKQYLPIPSSYNIENINDITSFYNDTVPYTMVSYPQSHSRNPVVIANPGEKMSKHPVLIDYLCNSETVKLLQCRRYVLSDNDDSESITLNGLWKGGSLDIIKTIDPDGCTLLTFTDWRGLKILERRLVNNTYADTYFLYDVKENLRVIIQPQGASAMATDGMTWRQSDNIVRQYAFVYRYDSHNNCIYAKLPGTEATESRYDRLGRLAFRANATMRQYNEAEFILYDKIGRIAVTGITNNGIPTNDNIPLMTSTYDNSSRGIGDTGYSCPDGLDLSVADINIVNYYDTYDYLSRPNFASFPTLGINFNPSTAKGKLTATLNGILYDSKYTFAINCFDKEGRCTNRIETSSLDGAYMHTVQKYTRQSNIFQTNINLYTPDSIYSVDKYDNRDIFGNPINLFTQARSYKNDNYVPLARSIEAISYGEDFFYDPLGRLSKSRREMFGDNETQYAYNLRGQLTSIANPTFTQALKYEDSNTPLYNGNISQMTLTYAGLQPVTRKYTYDSLDRLTGVSSTDGVNTAYTYNLNSSPTSITRYGMLSDGTIGIIDDISMTYNGNRLIKATEAADAVLLENSLDFAADAQYSYDDDGRLIADTGRDIEIQYNTIDRPATITTSRGKLLYDYSASGQKLMDRYTSNATKSSESRYYIGPFELIKNNNSAKPGIARINTNFGYFDSEGNANKQFTDFQGNVRAIITANSNAKVQTTDYYPYGMPIATSTGAAANRYKYSCKALETRDRINMYRYPFRQLMADVTLWSTPDPMAVLAPSASPYNAFSSNPIKYIDPLGLYRDLWDATVDALKNYPSGVSIMFSYDKNEWFLALDSNGKDPYVSGGEMYREFGSADKRWGGGGLYFSPYGYPFYQSSGSNNSSTTGWASNLNTGAAALGIATGAKTTLIDLAVPVDQQNGFLLRYGKIFKNVGRFTGIINAFFATSDIFNYKKNGGDKWYVYFKYSYDGANAIAPMFSGPAAPYIMAGSITYSIADWATDGFWIDYSVPNK